MTISHGIITLVQAEGSGVKSAELQFVLTKNGGETRFLVPYSDDKTTFLQLLNEAYRALWAQQLVAVTSTPSANLPLATHIERAPHPMK